MSKVTHRGEPASTVCGAMAEIARTFATTSTLIVTASLLCSVPRIFESVTTIATVLAPGVGVAPVLVY